MALKRLKKLRKERFGGNQAFNDPEKKRPRKVEYILVFESTCAHLDLN